MSNNVKEKTSKKKVTRTTRSFAKAKEVWRRFKKNKGAMIGLVILSALVLTAVFSNFIVPYEKAIEQNPRDRLLTPSAEHLFGTDEFGRDMFARIVHAAPTSLFIGFTVSFTALTIGSIVGVTCAYFGGKIDGLLMRFIDVMSSIPGTLLSMVVVAVLGPSMRNMIIAMTISRVRFTARMSRSAVFTISGNEYIEAARAGGCGHTWVMLKHIVPNIMGTLIVNGTMAVGTCITAACSLSFIGLGVQPPTPEWGYMLNAARQFMRGSSYLMIAPGLAIMLSALSINLVGDGLRDALDPKLKN